MTKEWTIPDLLQLSGGYWSTCALHAGVKLDIFSIVEGTARTAPEVAQLSPPGLAFAIAINSRTFLIGSDGWETSTKG